MLFNTDDGPRLPRRPHGRAGRRRRRARRTSGSRRSATCSAAIKTAKLLGLGPDDASITVATDGAALYAERAGQDARRATSAAGSATLDAAEVFGEHLGSAPAPTTCSSCTEQRPQPHLQPRLLHVGRAAGHAARGVRGPALAGVLAGAAPLPRRLGRADRRLQRPRRRRAGDAASPASAARSAGPRSTSPRRRRGAARTPPTTTATTCCRSCRRPGPPADRSTTPTRSSRSAPRWRGRRSRSTDGMTVDAAAALVRQLDERVTAVGGAGFVVTPFARADALSDALGFADDGGVWVKDETGNVGRAATRPATCSRSCCTCRRPSCSAWRRSRAAAAGHRLVRQRRARRGHAGRGRPAWPLEVFVPPWADPSVVDALRRAAAPRSRSARGATTTRLAIPCVHRFREAVAAGAVPFSVQGPENALCLDGGRTIGWEMGDASSARRSTGSSCRSAAARWPRASAERWPSAAVGRPGCTPCRPRAAPRWPGPGERASSARRRARPRRTGTSACGRGRTSPARRPTGILDDETYDWLGRARRGRRPAGGSLVVAPEAAIVEAHELGPSATGIAVERHRHGRPGRPARHPRRRSADDERVAVVFSGVER